MASKILLQKVEGLSISSTSSVEYIMHTHKDSLFNKHFTGTSVGRHYPQNRFMERWDNCFNIHLDFIFSSEKAED